MSGLVADLRYALRMLAKSPSYTATAVLALALGIGANSAIFSVVNAVLLRPLPYPHAEQLVALWDSNLAKNVSRSSFSSGKLFDVERQQKSFANVGGYYLEDLSLPAGDRAEPITTARTVGQLLETVGVAPAVGRAFTDDENRFGGPTAIILSHSLWQRRFNSDARLVGQTIQLSKAAYTVVGVMPAGFEFPAKAQAWIPAALHPSMFTSAGGRLSRFITVVGRLREGISAQQANADIAAIAQRAAEQFPQVEAGWTVQLGSLQEQTVARAREALLIVFGAVGVVLLIACVNVANLQLTRAEVRRKEMALRAALGASRGRLIRQFLVESLTLSLIGGAAGALLATWGVDVLIALSAGQIPRGDEIRPDATVFLFTIGLTTAAGLLFGIAPALSASRAGLDSVLREAGQKATAGKRAQRLRSALLVSQVALALVLLISATLLIRSLRNVQRVDPGFSRTNVLTLKLSLPWERSQQAPDFYGRTLQRLEELPGVQSAGAINFLPLNASSTPLGFTIVGGSQAAEARLLSEFRIVTPGYFNTLGIPLQRGRNFEMRDAADAPLVVLVNDTFARRFFGSDDPVGQQLIFPGGASGPVTKQIVGVVGSVHHGGLDKEPVPEIYLAHAQSPWPSMSLAIRSAVAAETLAPMVQRALYAIDPSVPAFDIQTIDERLNSSVAERRFNMWLLASFAAIALSLAAIGIYGVIAYGVSQRTREVGIRLALGAQRWDVLRLVLGEGFRLTAFGIALGLGAAFVARRVIANLLFGVTPADPLTFGAMTVLLGAIALLACWLPARRATRVNPIEALRSE